MYGIYVKVNHFKLFRVFCRLKLYISKSQKNVKIIKIIAKSDKIVKTIQIVMMYGILS